MHLLYISGYNNIDSAICTDVTRIKIGGIVFDIEKDD